MASGKIAYLAHGQRGKKIKNKGSYQRSLHIWYYFTTTKDIYQALLNIFLSNIVKRLYKTLLKLHRGLPPDLAYMGDMYVKDEFKRHKLATPEQTVTFMESWAVSWLLEMNDSCRNLLTKSYLFTL